MELVQRLARAAGIRDPASVSTHVLRHSVAAAHLEAGEPIDHVRALLGHAEMYARLGVSPRDYLQRSPAYRMDYRLAKAVGRHGATHHRKAFPPF